MKTQRDTPEWLAKKMVEEIHSGNRISYDQTEIDILEPSAGSGAIIKALTPGLRKFVTAVELNKDKCKEIDRMNEGVKVIHNDFLAHDFKNQLFDFVIAAPPFKNNDDIHHIIKMYSLLKPNGTIVTLTTPYWTINNEEHHKLFRYFLDGKTHCLEMLPDNTFMEKGRTVPTALLTIYK